MKTCFCYFTYHGCTGGKKKSQILFHNIWILSSFLKENFSLQKIFIWKFFSVSTLKLSPQYFLASINYEMLNCPLSSRLPDSICKCILLAPVMEFKNFTVVLGSFRMIFKLWFISVFPCWDPQQGNYNIIIKLEKT